MSAERSLSGSGQVSVTRQQSSARQLGVCPNSDWCTRVATLSRTGNWIICEIGYCVVEIERYKSIHVKRKHTLCNRDGPLLSATEMYCKAYTTNVDIKVRIGH